MSSFFYKVEFHKHHLPTTVTSYASVVDTWIENVKYKFEYKINKKLIVGLDTEWCLDKHQTVAVLQLCVGHRCLIFQIKHADFIPQSLVDFLANDKFVFVGVNVKEDAAKLKEDYGLVVSCTRDVRKKFAIKYHDNEYSKYGLNALSNSFLGLVMSKPKHITMSKWDVEKLSSDQVEYAAIDAFVSFKLGMEAKRPLDSVIEFSIHDIYGYK